MRAATIRAPAAEPMPIPTLAPGERDESKECVDEEADEVVELGAELLDAELLVTAIFEAGVSVEEPDDA
jgi:hypothetical protein